MSGFIFEGYDQVGRQDHEATEARRVDKCHLVARIWSFALAQNLLAILGVSC